MQTDQQEEASAVFLQTLTGALSDLKNRLQHHYEQAYPGLADIIHIILDEEEANAQELSFPHLFLPDLVDAHIAKLGLQLADTRHDNVLAPRGFTEIQTHRPVLAYVDS
jgi:hypothetical protein